MKTPMINIHHSFLPAFVGGILRAGVRARVKIIGATAHYVTEELERARTSRTWHASRIVTAAELSGIGRDIERTVLARAVKWHSRTASSFMALAPSSSSRQGAATPATGERGSRPLASITV